MSRTRKTRVELRAETGSAKSVLRRPLLLLALVGLAGLAVILMAELPRHRDGQESGPASTTKRTAPSESTSTPRPNSSSPPVQQVAAVRAEDGEAVLPSLIARRTAVQDDPRLDGWDSEVQSERAGAQLKVLGDMLAHRERRDSKHAGKVVSPAFSCGRLRPRKLHIAFKDKALTVRRATEADRASDQGSKEYLGVEGLVHALNELAEPFIGAGHVHVKFKIFRVDKSDTALTTVAYFEAGGPTKTGSLEQHATWTCRWAAGADDAWQLESITVHDYEESVLYSPDSTMFVDCTEAVLGHNDCFRKQLMLGAEHWRRRLETTLGMDTFGHQGIAVGDVNGDGLEDVFVCGAGGFPCRLFVQNPDGTATDRAAEAGVDWLVGARAALFIDLDNDGDQDLVISTLDGLVFMENDGTGRFTLRAVLRNLAGMYSLAAADYDNDGYLDIFVCNYSRVSLDELNTDRFPRPLPFYDANNSGGNHLLKNDGHWHFKDVTKEVGLDVRNRRWSFAASWEDYNNDGLIDLCVANDFGRKNLYKNLGGRFEEIAAEAGTEDMGFGMSVTWGDYNRDGWMDLYFANMWSSAGGRITTQPSFKPGASPRMRANVQRLAKGNTLLRNTGNGKFEDVGVEAAVEMGRWSWGSLFVDLDNDGWEDLVVMNGYITNEDSADL